MKFTTENQTPTLQQLYERHKKGDWPDKGSVHSYIEVYEQLLAPYRTTAKNILEIGLMSGESLRMWTDYFSGTVYGMDCSLTPLNGVADLRPIILEGRHNIVIGDASNPADIEKYLYGIKFDVVIEDANHDLDQQLAIYKNLKPYLSPGSVYIIEDVQNIDATKHYFLTMDLERIVLIRDRRSVKGRYDDVLVIIKDK